MLKEKEKGRAAEVIKTSDELSVYLYYRNLSVQLFTLLLLVFLFFLLCLHMLTSSLFKDFGLQPF